MCFCFGEVVATTGAKTNPRRIAAFSGSHALGQRAGSRHRMERTGKGLSASFLEGSEAFPRSLFPVFSLVAVCGFRLKAKIPIRNLPLLPPTSTVQPPRWTKLLRCYTLAHS